MPKKKKRKQQQPGTNKRTEKQEPGAGGRQINYNDCIDSTTGEVNFFYDSFGQILHPNGGPLENCYSWQYIGYKKAETIFKKHSGENGSLKTLICQDLGITRQTLINWINQDKYLKALFENYRANSDDFVFSKLMERIKGYDHPETKVFCYQGEIYSEDVTRHYPPDIKAIQTYFQMNGMLIDKKAIEQKVNLSGGLESKIKEMTPEEIDKELEDLKNLLE